jgi:hypothetical protein
MTHKLPPLIEGWIEGLNDTRTPEHIRENYRLMLDQVQQEISVALEVYNRKKKLAYSAKRR